jgi:phthiodiolone/phenolphthiodiolone dimycocerosates ketoreductase
MLRLTGKYGDGWYPHMVASPEDYAARLEVIRAAAREAGRDPDAITPAMHAPVIVAPTEDEARAMLDHPVVRFLGATLPAAVWQAFGLQHPLGERFGGIITDFLPETYDRATLKTAIAAVPRAMVEGLICGTPAQVAARLQAFGDAGMRYVVPLLLSAWVSPEAAAFSVQAMGEIAQALRQPAAVAAD